MTQVLFLGTSTILQSTEVLLCKLIILWHRILKRHVFKGQYLINLIIFFTDSSRAFLSKSGTFCEEYNTWYSWVSLAWWCQGTSIAPPTAFSPPGQMSTHVILNTSEILSNNQVVLLLKRFWTHGPTDTISTEHTLRTAVLCHSTSHRYGVSHIPQVWKAISPSLSLCHSNTHT